MSDKETIKEKLRWWIAGHVPRWLVYLCTMRLFGEVTSGEWSDTVCPELTVMDALCRWHN